MHRTVHAGFPIAILVLGAGLGLGCGGTVPGVAAPDEGLPLVVPPQTTPAASARLEDEPEPAPPGPGETTGPCPLQWTPREMHASVFTLPAELYGRMMAPLIRALCTCTRPGQSILVAARVVPERGEVTARTTDRPEYLARASRSIDACLARELGAGALRALPRRERRGLGLSGGVARDADPGAAGAPPGTEAGWDVVPRRRSSP